MTRFARAAGAKACNKRVPEDATPWGKLKPEIPENANKYSPREKTNFKQKRDTKFGNRNKQQSKIKNESSPPVRINWKMNIKNPDDNTIENTTTSTVRENPIEMSKKKTKKEGEYKRRKPITDIPSIFVDGVETGIARFEGFPVKKSDAKRLKELKRNLIASNVPRKEIEVTLKAERRRAEKALARQRRKTCFHCRHSGHVLSECPELNKTEVEARPSSGICFKCGSTEHQHNECKAISGDNYKYAMCFICKEEGHISKQCPDNPRGLYPQGGACRTCGDVTHLKKDCPKFVSKKKQEFEVTVDMLDNSTPDSLDQKVVQSIPKIQKKKKIIKMK